MYFYQNLSGAGQKQNIYPVVLCNWTNNRKSHLD